MQCRFTFVTRIIIILFPPPLPLQSESERFSPVSFSVSWSSTLGCPPISRNPGHPSTMWTSRNFFVVGIIFFTCTIINASYFLFYWIINVTTMSDLYGQKLPSKLSTFTTTTTTTITFNHFFFQLQRPPRLRKLSPEIACTPGLLRRPSLFLPPP